MLKHDITGYNICVTLSIQDFLLFDELAGSLCKKRGEQEIDLIVYTELEKSGASNIDFDGHFGPHIFFTVDSLKLVDRVKNKIEKILNKHRHKFEWDEKEHEIRRKSRN